MKTTTALFGSTLILLASACASPKVIAEYKDEIRDLREERTQLKKRNRDLQYELEQAEIAIANSVNTIDSSTAGLKEFEIPTVKDFGIEGVHTGLNERGDLVVTISNDVTFSSGKATLTENGKRALKDVARELNADYGGREYWIEGHTDSDPIKKSSWGSNRELSYARASAVHTFLVEDCGVPDEACRVVAVGQYEPAENGSSKAAKAANRRVQIVVRR